MIRLVPLSIFALLLLASTLWSQGLDASDLRRKQYTQQQAQALTRQLVTQVLDLQEAQLKQNGLTRVPLYQDIVQMRGNLDHLIREEMQGVVQRLIDAQHTEGQARIDAIQAAREEIRQVLLALMAERQRLFRRMRLARLHVQVRELIRVQEKVTAQTRELPQLPMESRDEAALANLARQTDVEGMYRQLEEVLLDIRSWGGSLAASAVAGQQILKEARADSQVQGALASLRQGRFTDAIEHQDAFIVALYKILENIHLAQGVVDNRMESTITQIERLRDEQQQLRDETETSDLSPEAADQLSQKQEAIQNKLEDMVREMGKMPENAAALAEASEAAAEAVAELFEADRSAAVAKQDEVLAHLEKFKEHLSEPAIPSNIASAEQRKEQVAALTQAKQRLEEALERQTQAKKQFADSPEDTQAAAQAQRDAVAKLDTAGQTPKLPEAVQPMIAEAKSQGNKAAIAAERNSEEGRHATSNALAEAADATRQALENVASTLADAQRQQLATEIGELARAAEALDRAAAAQQKVARDASRIANDAMRLQNVDRWNLTETQSDVAAVAIRVREGTETMAPQAAASLNEAQQAIRQASESAKGLAKDQQSPEAMEQQAQQLQAASREAQKKLFDAANALRNAAKDAAQQLVEIAGEQLKEIDSVDEALVALPLQKTFDQTQASLNTIANEAGMISPEAAARLRQPTAEKVAKFGNQTATDDSSDTSAAMPTPPSPEPTEPAASSPESPGSQDGGGEAKPEPASTASTERRIQQARAELAGRRQPIAEDQKTAEQLAVLLHNISGAGEEIQTLAEQFLAEDNTPPAHDSQSNETPPVEDTDMGMGKPAAPQPAENPIATQLAESMRRFASSQRQATQLAANSAQQSQIANQPVREALQTASRLPVPLAQPDGTIHADQNGDSSGQAIPDSNNAASEPADESADSSLGPGSPSRGESQMAEQSSPSSNSSLQSAEMGNSMVSPTPQMTAQALAGQEVMESLWGQVPELFADGDPANQEVASIDPTESGASASAMLDNPSSQQAGPNDAAPRNASLGSPTGQQSPQSQPTGSIEGGEGRESGSVQAPLTNSSNASEPWARSFEKEPWFTKLPPGTQQAIRASVRRTPPPGYEDRLRRYFENID